jgi:hypothetical protein
MKRRTQRKKERKEITLLKLQSLIINKLQKMAELE